MTEKRYRLAIACGGTGGHFYPGLTIAKEFNRRGAEAIVFIAGHQTQNQLDQASADNILAFTTTAVRLPLRKSRFPIFCVQFVTALFMNLVLLHRHRVDAVLCMGSYASAPLGVAAALYGKPLMLHEGNAVLGRTNRYLLRWTKVLMLSFPLRNGDRFRVPQKVVGMPLRESIVNAGMVEKDDMDRDVLYREYDLNPRLRTLLVFGGSQGARAINDLILNAISQINSTLLKFQIIHLTGLERNVKFTNFYRSKGIPSVVKKRDSNIEKLYKMADLIVCRAGASTIYELAYLGKPALYVPLPTAMDNHQRENVLRILAVDGGVLLDEDDRMVRNCVTFLKQWLKDPEQFLKKGQNLKKIARPNATKDIVDIIFSHFNSPLM